MIREEAGSDKAQGLPESRHWFCCVILASDKCLALRRALMVSESRGFGKALQGYVSFLCWNCSWSACSIDTLGSHPEKKHGRRYAVLYWSLLRENDRKRLSTEMKGMLAGRNWKKSHYLNSVVWKSQAVTQSVSENFNIYYVIVCALKTVR